MIPDQAGESYLTVAEVAELLRLNQQTVRNWIDQGSLPALRVGRRVRIKRSDLDRLLAEGYRAGGQSGARESGPSAEDFWGGEVVGMADTEDDAGNGTHKRAAPDDETGAPLGDLGPLSKGAEPSSGDSEPPSSGAEWSVEPAGPVDSVASRGVVNGSGSGSGSDYTRR